MILLALLSVLAWTNPAGGSSVSQEALVGSWQLVSCQDHPASGSSVFPFGLHPGGLLIDCPTGHMSIQVMKDR